MGKLRQALRLNPNTFDTSAADRVQRFALEQAGSKDQILLNTQELDNLLGSQALEQLKATFGTAPTEGERAILLSLQGINAKSKEERAKIITNAYAALADKKARSRKRLDLILSGAYRDTKPIDSED